MVKGKKYSILWIDTFGQNGWYDEEMLESKAKEMQYYQESVGFYVGEWYGFVVVAAVRNPNENFAEWGHPEWIPKSCIKKTKELK